MNAVTAYLQELGLNDAERLDAYIWQTDADTLLGLVEYLRELIEEGYTLHEHTPFTFVPNDDISGTGGCSELSCKVRRAARFATFSALYADHVYIQLSLITSPHYTLYYEARDFNAFRYGLHCDLAMLNTYAALIDAGIVCIAPPKRTYCKNCFQAAILGTTQHIPIEQIQEAYVQKAELVLDKYIKPSDTYFIRIEHMDEFFPEHGILITFPGDELHQMLPTLDQQPFQAPIRDQAFKTGFINHFVSQEFYNVCYYAAYCKEQQAKLITNKPSDSIFMALAQSKASLPSVEKAQLDLPQYDMPFIQGVRLQDVLKLRENEQEAFNKYRIALNAAVSEQAKTAEQKDWMQIYDDILYPAFNDLDFKLNQIKSKQYHAFLEMSILGTVILAGTYSGIVPQNTTELFSSIGLPLAVARGSSLLDKVGLKKTALKENDFYFLWKLKKNARTP